MISHYDVVGLVFFTRSLLCVISLLLVSLPPLFFFKDFMYLFLERGRKGEKYQCVREMLMPASNRGQACNPGMWESNQQPPVWQASAQPLSHISQGVSVSFKL